MIKTPANYHEAIEFLTTEATVGINDINEKMNAGEVNFAFANIEMYLLDLYEKTRVLEDVQNYCREYVIKEIEERRLSFQSKLKVIEHNADSYQENTFVACEVPFSSSNESIYDRDGTALPASDIINGKIYMSGQEIEKIEIKNITKKQEHAHYRDNLNDLTQGEPYRVFYLLDSPINNGLEEELTLFFEETKKCNFIDIKSTNIKIVDIKYINEFDAEEPFGDINNVCSITKNAKGIKLKIRASNYQNENYEIDAKRIKNDSFTMIQEELYRRRSPGTTSLYEMSQIIGMAQYAADQVEFKRAIEAWQLEKDLADRRNIVMMQKYGGDE